MSARRIKIKARRTSSDQLTRKSSAALDPTQPSAYDPYNPLDIPLDFDPAVEPSLEELDSLYASYRSRYVDRHPSNSATPPAAATATAATAIAQPTPGRCTGPRTEDGKARSSQNALKHGLSMPAGPSMTFLPHEDTDAHTLLLLQFNQQFVPMTGAEKELVREIVDSLWLARRARDLQASALETADHHALSLYLRYETAHQRAHNAAIKTLLAVQKDRRLRNQNHEQWDEPVLWGGLDFVVMPDSTPAMSAYSAATTSPASTDTGSSFRNPLSTSPLEFADASPNPSQTAPHPPSEEVNVAA